MVSYRYVIIPLIYLNIYNFIFFKELLRDVYKKTQTQLGDYIKSNYTARIRENSKQRKLIKDNVINSMYRKLSKGMSSIEFVETFCSLDFEKFLEEQSQNLRDEQAVDLNHFIQPLHEIDFNQSKFIHKCPQLNFNNGKINLTGLIDPCSVCLSMKPIIAGYPSCMHIILCIDCMHTLKLMPNGPNNTYLCVKCRTPSDDIKMVYR